MVSKRERTIRRALVRRFALFLFFVAMMTFGGSRVALAGIPADRVPVFFPQSWTPDKADVFIHQLMGGDTSNIVTIKGRQAILVPRDRTFSRWVVSNAPKGLRPSWYVSQQFHGQGQAPVPAWVARNPDLAKTAVRNRAAYFFSAGMVGHDRFGYNTSEARAQAYNNANPTKKAVHPVRIDMTVDDLAKMAPMLEIDQESILAYLEDRLAPLRHGGEFSIVAMDHGPWSFRNGVWQTSRVATRVGAFVGATATRVGNVSMAAGRTAYAAARFAAYDDIGTGVFARAAGNSANWSVKARFGFGAARFGASMVGGFALGYAVDKGVTRMTGSKDLGFAAGYAAGAYGGYATESVIFGRAAGSVAMRASLYLLPLAVHMHIMSTHINAPLEQAMQDGDEEAKALYDRFNWGFGLGALGYGVESYATTVGGWMGL
jgi:hypothetical protein